MTLSDIYQHPAFVYFVPVIRRRLCEYSGVGLVGEGQGGGKGGGASYTDCFERTQKMQKKTEGGVTVF